MKKRVFSLLLALALLCSLLPQIAPPVHADTPYSGSCGRNLTWTFDPDTGTLSFQGSGDMEDYDFETAPWYPYHDSVTSVSFPSSLTSIGAYSFFNFGIIKELSLPDGVKSIGEQAFRDCDNIASITLPAGLLSIGEFAFEFCDNLTKVVFPAGLTSIGIGVFHDCISLKELTFPEGLTSIGGSSFYGCISLAELTFPAGLTTIDNFAFWGCTGLKNISLPGGLNTINSCAFGCCTGLKKADLPAGLVYIDSDAFYHCSNLTEYSVAEWNQYYNTDAYGVLFNKDRTVLISYPCGRTGSYEVPAGVLSIETSAFDGCSSLTEIIFPSELSSIGDFAFFDCTSLTELSLPTGLTVIGTSTFWGCTGLTEITFPAWLTSIGRTAFGDCDSLTVLTFPERLDLINNLAFYDCDNLREVNLPAGLTCIGEEAFYNCKLSSIVVPSSVTKIGKNAIGYKWLSPITDFTIYGYSGTAAETYANENGFRFVPIAQCAGEHSYVKGVCTRCGYAAPSASDFFTDVPDGKFYSTPVLWAIRAGVTSGTDESHFGPKDTCTRGHVVTFLWNMMGQPEPDMNDNPFVDVPEGKFYTKAVLWAYQNNVTSGVDDTHFNPKGNCTRAHVVTFLWNAKGQPEPKAEDTPFVDVKPNKFYTKAVLWAYQNGVTSGLDDTHFGTSQTCTRGQVVTFLYNAFVG